MPTKLEIIGSFGFFVFFHSCYGIDFIKYILLQSQPPTTTCRLPAEETLDRGADERIAIVYFLAFVYP